jgi:hypothetical protein
MSCIYYYFSYTVNYNISRLAAYPTCFDIYSIIFMSVYFVLQNEYLLNVVVFLHISDAYKLFVEKRILDKYIVYYICSCTCTFYVLRVLRM